MVYRYDLFKPLLSSMPMWVDFKSVPGHYFSYKGLSFLASHLGCSVKLHPSMEKCLLLDVACVLVKVNLQNPLPSLINVPEEKYPAVQIHDPFNSFLHIAVLQKRGHLDKEGCTVSILRKGEHVEKTVAESVTPAMEVVGEVGNNEEAVDGQNDEVIKIGTNAGHIELSGNVVDYIFMNTDKQDAVMVSMESKEFECSGRGWIWK